MRTSRRSFLQGLASAGLLGSLAPLPVAAATGKKQWWKGMLHAHTLWSDGQSFPEEAVDLYKQRGFHFFSLTEHNTFATDKESWRTVVKKNNKWPPKPTEALVQRYLTKYKDEADLRQKKSGEQEVRLKTFAEMAARSNVPGKFLLLPGCEITQWLKPNGIQVHLNTINIPEVPALVREGPLSKGFDISSAAELIGLDIKDVVAQEKAGTPSLLTLNHPFWRYCDILPQDLITNSSIRFFEISNGGTNYGHVPELSGYQPDSFWDAILAFRLAQGNGLIYAQGVDDTHTYFGKSIGIRKAWNMVRSADLSANSLLNAMQQGDFYASTGVELEEVLFDPRQKQLQINVKPKNGESYEILFIVTKKGFDQRVSYVENDGEKGRGHRKIPVYSPQIGQVAKRVQGISGSYQMADDDLYVRAKIISTAKNATFGKRWKHFYPTTYVAWTQPVR